MEQSTEVAIKQEYEAARPAVAQEMETLQQRPLSVMTAHYASDFRGRCDAAMKVIDDKMAPIIEKAYQTHRALTAMRNEMKGPYQRGKEVANGILGRWQIKLDEEAAAERRRVEEEARQAAEAEAKAKADALAAEAAAVAEQGDEAGAELLLEEAAKVEAEPIVPMVAPVAEPVRKVGNTTTSFRLKGTVTHAPQLIEWLVAHPDMIVELVEWRQGNLDRALNRGVKLPGVQIVKVPVSRATR